MKPLQCKSLLTECLTIWVKEKRTIKEQVFWKPLEDIELNVWRPQLAGEQEAGKGFLKMRCASEETVTSCYFKCKTSKSYAVSNDESTDLNLT